MAQTTLEEMIAAARMLPLDDQRRLREWLERQEYTITNDQSQPETLQPARERSRKARQWLEVNRPHYLGQWVALDGDHLISHGTDGRLVMAQVKASGIRQPFIELVTEDSEPFCGGWLP
jgi:hypothetical protein